METDSKQILNILEKYSKALELLDSYDHQTMTRPKDNRSFIRHWRKRQRSCSYHYDCRIQTGRDGNDDYGCYELY